MLSLEQEKHFHDLLLKRQDEFEATIKELETPPDFGDYPGPDDNTDESEELFNRVASARAVREQLAEVQHALGKFEKKTYGVCEATGKEISATVLEVNPETRFDPAYVKEHRNNAEA